MMIFNIFFPSPKIEIVVARYNENLDWLRHDPFNKYSTIIYNKGESDIQKFGKITKIVQLNNVGRCDGTFLHHIVTNYDHLSTITLFFPGSLNISRKYTKAVHLVNKIELYKDTVFMGARYSDVQKILYEFLLDEWTSTDTNNYKSNPESVLTPANIRPFGKWYQNKFGNLKTTYVSYTGILGIHKKDILKRTKSFYKTLLDEVNVSSNPEVGHYIERSWQAIFDNFSNAKCIHYIN